MLKLILETLNQLGAQEKAASKSKSDLRRSNPPSNAASNGEPSAGEANGLGEQREPAAVVVVLRVRGASVPPLLAK